MVFYEGMSIQGSNIRGVLTFSVLQLKISGVLVTKIWPSKNVTIMVSGYWDSQEQKRLALMTRSNLIGS